MLRPERGLEVRFLQGRKACEGPHGQWDTSGFKRGIEAGGREPPPAVLSAHPSSVCLPGRRQASSGCDSIYYWSLSWSTRLYHETLSGHFL